VKKEEIKQIIQETVDTTVRRLKAEGLLVDTGDSAIKKVEELLRQYPALKNTDTPYAKRVVQEVDACLAEAEQDPYVDVIRLYYFAGMKNVACANTLCCEERTCRRNRRRLVEQFAVRLAAEDFISELQEV
jgi:lipase chaperone LimK